MSGLSVSFAAVGRPEGEEVKPRATWIELLRVMLDVMIR